MTRARVLVAVAALALCGCGLVGPRGCTSAGCGSSVSVDATPVAATYSGATATLCVRDRCTTQEISVERPFVSVLLGPDNAGPDAEFSVDEPLPVHLTLVRPGAAPLDVTAQATLEKLQPNGERCEPTCWGAAYQLTEDGLRELDANPAR